MEGAPIQFLLLRKRAAFRNALNNGDQFEARNQSPPSARSMSTATRQTRRRRHGNDPAASFIVVREAGGKPPAFANSHRLRQDAASVGPARGTPSAPPPSSNSRSGPQRHCVEVISKNPAPICIGRSRRDGPLRKPWGPPPGGGRRDCGHRRPLHTIPPHARTRRRGTSKNKRTPQGIPGAPHDVLAVN